MKAGIGDAAVLGLFVSSLDQPSETFIRAHATRLAPGRTVVFASCESSMLPELPQVVVPPMRRTALSWPMRKLLGMAEWLRTGSRMAADRRQEAFILRALAEHRVAVALAEYGPTGCQIARACRQSGVSLYVHFHGFDATMLARDPRWRREYRRLWPQVAGVICPSRFLAGRVERLGCPDERIHINPLGVEPGAFSPDEPNRRDPGLVLAVGRLVEKKAPQLTIRAFGKVAGRLPQVRLEMVGAGPLEALCRRTIADLGLGERVVLHGAKEHAFVTARMRRASLFVQHSVTAASGDMESFGISVLEAMASGVPVVTTRHNGFPEVVLDRTTGVLVPEGDVEAMADAMLELLRRPELARRMGEAGRRRALEHFTMERSLARLRTILRLGEASPA